MTGRQRVTPAWIDEVRERVSDADLQIIRTIATVRVATTDQIRRAHFAVGYPPSQGRVARRHLRRLADLGVLTPLDRRVGGQRGGSAQAVWALDRVGQHLTTSSGPARGDRIRRPWTPGQPYLRHSIAITEIFISGLELQRVGSLKIIRFATEPACWKTFAGRAGLETLKPDAHLEFSDPTYDYSVMLEVDLATESATAIDRKIDRYLRHHHSVAHKERDLYPLVVWLTSSRPRAELIRARVDHTRHARRLMKVGLLDQAWQTLLNEAPSEIGVASTQQVI